MEDSSSINGKSQAMLADDDAVLLLTTFDDVDDGVASDDDGSKQRCQTGLSEFHGERFVLPE